MRSLIRGLAVLVTAAAALWAVPSAALAAPSPSPSGQSESTSSDPCEVVNGYAAPANCQVLVDDAHAACTDDLSGANLTYGLTVAGGLAATTVTVTFSDPSGAKVSVPGQPLSGSVAWPSAVKAASSTVTFTTQTPTPYTVATSITTPTCISEVLADDGPGSGASGLKSAVLASTGAQVGPLAAIAGGLVAIGVALLVVVRRRRAATR